METGRAERLGEADNIARAQKHGLYASIMCGGQRCEGVVGVLLICLDREANLRLRIARSGWRLPGHVPYRTLSD